VAAGKLAAARSEMMNNVRERMQLKQSMLELEDQNLQNQVWGIQ
jgi:hypothetical protein